MTTCTPVLRLPVAGDVIQKQSIKEGGETMNYEIAFAPTLNDLRTHVDEAINKGWMPVGGVATIQEDGTTTSFTQALVRRPCGSGEPSEDLTS